MIPVDFVSTLTEDEFKRNLLWVSVLIGSYRRAIVGGTPVFPGQLIILLLVAHWLERWCASLARFDSWHIPFRDSYYKGEPDHAAATHHVFVCYTLI